MSEAGEARAVRASTRGLLGELAASHPPADDEATPVPYPRAVWQALADRLGLQGVRVPEQLGGAGMDLSAELAVHEEMGRALHGGPYLSTVSQVLPVLTALAGSVADRGADGAVGDLAVGDLAVDLVTDIVAGTVRAVAVCAPGPEDRSVLPRASGPAEPGTVVHLDGTVRLVPAGADADGLMVHAVDDAGSDLLVWIRADQPGVRIRWLESLDLTRAMAEVELGGAVATVLVRGAPATAAVRRMEEGAALALCAESIGVAAAALEMSVTHLGVREQFGRTLGSFQALKHQAADLHVLLESARSALALAADTCRPGRGEEDDIGSLHRTAALAVARRRCGEAAFRVAGEVIHLHGGIGFTWEHPAHRFYRRAKVNQVLLDPCGQQGRTLTAAVAGLYAASR